MDPRTLRALAGLGIFFQSAGVDVAEFARVRDVAVLHLAGQRDFHTTPRAVAQAVDAMTNASPCAVAVIRRGTHCFLDEFEEYAYPPLQARSISHWSPYDRVRVVNFIP